MPSFMGSIRRLEGFKRNFGNFAVRIFYAYRRDGDVGIALETPGKFSGVFFLMVWYLNARRCPKNARCPVPCR